MVLVRCDNNTIATPMTIVVLCDTSDHKIAFIMSTMHLHSASNEHSDGDDHGDRGM